MKHIQFTETCKPQIALLIKETALNKSAVFKHYIEPISKHISKEQLVAYSLWYDSSNKVTAKDAKAYLTDVVLPAIKFQKIKYLLVADATYFKYLSGVKKLETAHGYIYNCVIPGYEDTQIIYTINYQAMVYNPDLQNKLDTSIQTLISHLDDKYEEPGKDIIRSCYYPALVTSKYSELKFLAVEPELTCDIETTGLRFNESQIYTIAFAKNKHESIAFRVDDEDTKHLLMQFFQNYDGKIWFHNALFDAKFLIYHLFMKHDTDYVGMRRGLKAFENVQDTMIYTYLALNSTGDIKLGLKANSQEYTGNYALDDEAWTDITKLPIEDVLKYNLVDTLATWYVKEKYEPIVIADKQMDVYNNILQPSIKPLLEMMLIGLPLDLTKVTEAKIKLEMVRDDALRILRRQPSISTLEFDFKVQQMIEANKKLKRKIRTFDECKDFKFNPGSGKQVQYLLYDILKLPIIDYTKKKQPATGQKTLAKLQAYTNKPAVQNILDALIALSQSDKILNDFISNFQKLNFKRNDDTIWLNGDQVIGGTQSGRLSARQPNLANLPSNSIYGKTIKSCFVAPKGKTIVDMIQWDTLINNLKLKGL